MSKEKILDTSVIPRNFQLGTAVPDTFFKGESRERFIKVDEMVVRHLDDAFDDPKNKMDGICLNREAYGSWPFKSVDFRFAYGHPGNGSYIVEYKPKLWFLPERLQTTDSIKLTLPDSCRGDYYRSDELYHMMMRSDADTPREVWPYALIEDELVKLLLTIRLSDKASLWPKIYVG